MDSFRFIKKREDSWSRPVLLERLEALQDLSSKTDWDPKVAYQELESSSERLDDLMDQYFACLTLLEWHGESSPAVNRLLVKGLDVLRLAKVDRLQSRLRLAYGELFYRASIAEFSLRNFWLAGWLEAMNIWPRHSDQQPVLENSGFSQSLSHSSGESLFSGDPLRDLSSLDDESSIEVQWQTAQLKYLATKEVQHLVLALPSLPPVLKLELRMLISRETSPVKRVPSFSSLYKRLENGPDRDLCRKLSHIESLLKVKSVGDKELVEVGYLIQDLLSLPILNSRKLMALATLYFLLDKRRKKNMASFVKRTYHFLCVEFSAGSSRDCYNLETQEPKPAETARITSYANLTKEVTRAVGKGALSKYFSGLPIRLRSNSLEESREVIAGLLSDLKGPMMKFGQLFSYVATEFPEDWQDRFLELTDRGKWDKSLDPHSHLAKFATDIELREEPIGCGSISQVYRARIDGKSDLAVKILLPGIEEAMKSDLRVFRSLMTLFNIIDRQNDWNKIHAEIEKTLAGELDLSSEIATQEHLYEKFKTHPEIRIPKPYRSLSSDSVLTMDYVVGLRFDEFITLASQAERDLAGKTIVEYVVTSVRDGFFSSDPNPGNFLFSSGKVYFFDFGSTVKWDRTTCDQWNRLILSFLTSDAEGFVEILRELGSIKGSSSEESARVLFSAMTHSQPGFWNYPGVHAIDPVLLEKQIKSIAKIWFSQKANIELPLPFIQGLRVYYCHLFVVAKMQARWNWVELVTSIMAKTATTSATAE